MPTFHDAARLVPASLRPDTPLGYLRSLDPGSNATEFLICDLEGVTGAVILAAADDRWLFDFLPLDDDRRSSWQGVSFGAVEARVDLSSGSSGAMPRFSVGCVTVARGRVWLTAKAGGRHPGSVQLEIGTAAATTGQAGATFERWQLVQRDRHGEPTVLYEREPSTGAGARG